VHSTKLRIYYLDRAEVAGRPDVAVHAALEVNPRRDDALYRLHDAFGQYITNAVVSRGDAADILRQARLDGWAIARVVLP
jgi:hypothetical protein